MTHGDSFLVSIATLICHRTVSRKDSVTAVRLSVARLGQGFGRAASAMSVPVIPYAATAADAEEVPESPVHHPSAMRNRGVSAEPL